MSVMAVYRSGSMQTRILAVASEAGSGKAIVPVLLSLIRRGVEIKAFLSARVLSFVNQLPELASVGSFAPISKNQSVQDAIGTFSPDGILVGTTAGDSLERQLTIYARERNIRTVAAVDERYGYRRRFSDQDNNLCYLPDIIALMDEQCYTDALAEGLPVVRLHVTGSPILSYLVYHSTKLAQNAGPPAHVFDPSWKQATFVSETFARDNGSSPGERGRLGSFLGFTEETVRRDILSVLDEIGRPTVVIEKLHPSDEQVPKEGWMGSNLYWKQISGGDLWPLLLQSDVVIGMRSMALLEAALLGCRVASYQPNLIGDNQCAAVRFGVAARLDTPQDLGAWLLSNLSAETRYVPPPKELPFIRPDAAERVADLVLKTRRE